MVSAIFMASMLAVSGSGDVTLLQFTADWCGACQSVKPAVQRLVASGYPVREVNVDREPGLASQFRVTSVPCFVLLVNGREVERVNEASSYARLVQMFERVGANAATQAIATTESPVVRGQSAGGPRLPRPLAAFARNLGGRRDNRETAGEPLVQIEAPTAPVAPSAAEAPLTSQIPSAANPVTGFQPAPNNPIATQPGLTNDQGLVSVRPEEPTQVAAAQAMTEHPRARSEQDLHDLAFRATVRLRIDDVHGHSVGTGTIIDARQNEALVVTCGHVFRDSSGKGRIAVDLFTKGQVQTVNGTLISYDLERDLGFVAIPVGSDVTAAKVAPPNYPIQRGQAVFSVGCDRGGDPSIRPSRITGIDRYVGAPNIEVAGQPAEGRSGGGLFASDGHLIGVCNAADPADNEGIYAALPAIHWELERIGQRNIFASQENQIAAAATSSPDRRAMPSAMVPVSEQPGTPTPPAALASMPAGRMSQEPPRAELAIAPSPMAQTSPAAGHETEVICIVRSRNNPQGSEQLFILEQPSQDLLNRLANESRAQPIARMAQNPRVSPSESNVIRAQSNE